MPSHIMFVAVVAHFLQTPPSAQLPHCCSAFTQAARDPTHCGIDGGWAANDAAMSPLDGAAPVQPNGPATPHPAAARKRKGKLDGELQPRHPCTGDTVRMLCLSSMCSSGLLAVGRLSLRGRWRHQVPCSWTHEAPPTVHCFTAS